MAQRGGTCLPQSSDQFGSVAAAGEDRDDLADLAGVVAVGPLVEVPAQARDGVGEAAHPAKQQPAVAAMVRIGWLDDREQLDSAQRRRPLAPGQVDRAEVSEDPGEDLAAARRAEHAGVNERPPAAGSINTPPGPPTMK